MERGKMKGGRGVTRQLMPLIFTSYLDQANLQSSKHSGNTSLKKYAPYLVSLSNAVCKIYVRHFWQIIRAVVRHAFIFVGENQNKADLRAETCPEKYQG